LDALSQAVAEATQAEESWRGQIDAGVSALLNFLDQHGGWTQLVALEAPVSGATTVKCTERVHDALRPVLEEARENVIVGAEIKPSTWLIAELVVLGSLSVIRAHMLKAEDQPLSELAPSLISEIIDPYLSQAAEKIDNACDCAPSKQIARRAEMVPIRPHPRTVLALRAIASAPGLGTRAVGRAVGIDNSGQISGLLRRFEQRGLIENASSRQAKSGQRAWFLTPYGHRILEILTASFSTARWLEESEQVQASA
jgi:hypothetical protein